MLLIRDIKTRRVVLSTNDYRGLRFTTHYQIGFETLQVTVSHAGVGDKQGYELLVVSANGVLWEGRIEQVALSDGVYSITAIGIGPAALSDDPVSSVYYENRLTQWHTIPTTSSNWNVRVYEREAAFLGLRKNAVYTHNTVGGGIRWWNPCRANSATTDTRPNIKWIKLVLNRTGTQSGFYVRIVGRNDTSGVTTVLAELPLGNQGETTHEYTNATGWTSFEIYLLNLSGSSVTYSGEDNAVRVAIAGLQMSSFDHHPTVHEIINDVCDRSVVPLPATRNYERTKVLIGSPAVFAGVNGIEVIKEMYSRLYRHYGTRWYGGFWEHRVFDIQDDLPHRIWRIGDLELGEAQLRTLARNSLGVADPIEGLYTHVRVSFEEPSGKALRTAEFPTGLHLPYKRVKEYRSNRDTLSGAEFEAQYVAKLAGLIATRGTFEVVSGIRAHGGIVRPVAEVRAGDWVHIDSTEPGRDIKRHDWRRGGLIGKTTYDGDSDKLTIELIGNLQARP